MFSISIQLDQKIAFSIASLPSQTLFKRCAMKIGLGLHLWAGEEYYLDKKLEESNPTKKNISLQTA